MCFGLCLGLYCREELRRHKLYRALKHSLANARNRSSDLNLAGVAYSCCAVMRSEIEITGTLQKAGLAFSIDHNSEVSGRHKVLKAHVAGEQAFDRSDSRSDRDRVSIITGLL